MGDDNETYLVEWTIYGSTDRCCFAIGTIEHAQLAGSDQPVPNLGRRRILCMSDG